MPQRDYVNAKGPARYAAAVTPDDANDLAVTARSLYVGGAGNVKIDLYGEGTGITFVSVPAGTILPFRVARVYATGTTATGIVALA